VPLYLYRLRPALATAFGATLIADERVLSLRARSQAAAVSLSFEQPQALDLARGLLAVVDALAVAVVWRVGPVQPVLLDSPLLAVPLDLDARVGGVQVRRQPTGRYFCFELRGTTDGAPFLAEVWATPEQIAALAHQINRVCGCAVRTA
jgi:hypothetical protein